MYRYTTCTSLYTPHMNETHTHGHFTGMSDVMSDFMSDAVSNILSDVRSILFTKVFPKDLWSKTQIFDNFVKAKPTFSLFGKIGVPKSQTVKKQIFHILNIISQTNIIYHIINYYDYPFMYFEKTLIFWILYQQQWVLRKLNVFFKTGLSINTILNNLPHFYNDYSVTNISSSIH